MRATDGTSRTLLLRAGGDRCADTALVMASIVFALAIGVFLVVRRATGALTAPVPAPELVATAAGVCAWAVIVHRLAPRRKAFVWLPLCVLFLFAVGCSYPAARLVDWLVWLPAIGFIFWMPSAKRMSTHKAARISSQAREADAIAEKVLQRLTRVRTAEGNDAIRGTLVAEFAPGERQVTLYTGFCPPFELLPDVELNVADDSEADVKLAQVLHNGAQIDVRLSEPAEEPVAVTIELFAVQNE